MATIGSHFTPSPRQAQYSEAGSNEARRVLDLFVSNGEESNVTLLTEGCRAIADNRNTTEDEKALARIGQYLAKNRTPYKNLPPAFTAAGQVEILNSIKDQKEVPVGKLLAGSSLRAYEKASQLTGKPAMAVYTSLGAGYDELLNHPDVSGDEKTIARLGKEYLPYATVALQGDAGAAMAALAASPANAMAQVIAHVVCQTHGSSGQSSGDLAVLEAGFQEIVDNPKSSDQERGTAQRGIKDCKRAIWHAAAPSPRGIMNELAGP